MSQSTLSSTPVLAGGERPGYGAWLMGLVTPGPPKSLVIALRDALGIEDFIETGTYLGDTAAWAAAHFARVSTIEASLTLYEQRAERLSLLPNLHRVHGDSRNELKALLAERTRPSIFWLDGHYSFGLTFGAEAECPLLEELAALGQSNLPHVVLIDDARLFLAPPPPPHDPAHWPSLSEVLNALHLSSDRYVVCVDDVLVSVPIAAKKVVVNYCRTRPERSAQPKEGPAKKEPRTAGLLDLYDAGLWKPEQEHPLRLHLGCGERRLPGYINIDHPQEAHGIMGVRPDFSANILDLAFPNQTVDEIRLHHVFEHFSRVSAMALLVRFQSFLKVGGILHLETPDLAGSLLAFREASSFAEKMGAARHLAGDQAAPWAYHVDHWFKDRFVRTLSHLGFANLQIEESRWAEPPHLANVEVRAEKVRDYSMAELLVRAEELLWESLVADVERPTFEVWRAQLRQVLAGSLPNPPFGITSATPLAVSAILFSKDRPLQAEATIRSFYAHCRDAALCDLKVLYLATDPRMQSLYQRVQQEHPRVRLIPESGKNFKADLLSACAGAPHLLFLVDDSLFVGGFSLEEEISALFAHPDALGFSLRLGKNVTYCYPLDQAQNVPPLARVSGDLRKYNWTQAELSFNYPLEVSSSLYRAADLLPLLSGLEYQNPNTLEAVLAQAASAFSARRPELLCYERSVAFSAPLNCVQAVFPNRAGGRTEYSAEALADLFAEGLRIQVEAYRGMVPNACHQEVELQLSGPRLALAAHLLRGVKSRLSPIFRRVS